MRLRSLCARLACAHFVCARLACGCLALALTRAPLSGTALAAEPNDTFAQATLLDAGTLSISDNLLPGTGLAPDTYLGAFDPDGFDAFEHLLADDDDSSTFGNGSASGLTNIGVNPDGSIRLIVTGDGDLDFVGEHEETGGYKAFVEVFNAAGSPIDEFSVTDTLQPDVSNQHLFSNNSWVGGNFSINLNNTVDGFTGGDVDFFTFTGLTPNAMFSAETLSVGNIDTLLGWYNNVGTLLAQDDDSGTGVWSRLTGNVPANGQLTFAVTGNGDEQFTGGHAQQEFYDLQLTIAGSNLPGDFDGNGKVDADDLTHPTLGWQARFGNGLDGADFLTWQREIGSGAGSLASTHSVPEPASLWLALMALVPLLFMSRKTSQHH